MSKNGNTINKVTKVTSPIALTEKKLSGSQVLRGIQFVEKPTLSFKRAQSLKLPNFRPKKS